MKRPYEGSGRWKTNIIGAKIFLRLRSYTSTSYKQDQPIFDTIEHAVDENPLNVASTES